MGIIKVLKAGTKVCRNAQLLDALRYVNLAVLLLNLKPYSRPVPDGWF